MATTDLGARLAELVRDEPDLPDLTGPAMAAGRRRRRARTTLAGCAAAIVLAATTLTAVQAPWQRLSHPASGPLACGQANLSVSFDGQTIRVHNNGSRACRLAGRYPVSIAWHQVTGPGPVAATGVLPTGGTYVQPYRVFVSGCLADIELPIKPTQVPVRVENDTLHVTMTQQNARNMLQCESATALPPRIER